MKITSLRIKNLYSFEDENIAFNDFNLIVGPNGGGKTNLIRSLKTLINKTFETYSKESNHGDIKYASPIGPQTKLENLLFSTISPDIKLFLEKKSLIKLELQLSKDELKLLFEFIFKQDIKIDEIRNYDKAIFTLLVSWPVEYSNSINPDLLIFRFPNGFTFLYLGLNSKYITYIENNCILDDFFQLDISSSEALENFKKEKFCDENNFTMSSEDIETQKNEQLLIFNELYNNEELILPLQSDNATYIKIKKLSRYDEPIKDVKYFEYRKAIEDSLYGNRIFISSILNNNDEIRRMLKVSYFKLKYDTGGSKLNKGRFPQSIVFPPQPLTYYESYKTDEPIIVKYLLLYPSDNFVVFKFPQRYDKQYFSDIKDIFFDIGSKIDLSHWVPDIWLFLSNLIFNKIILFNEIPDDENILTDKLFNLKTEDGFEKNYSDVKNAFKQIFGNGLYFDVVKSGNNNIIKVRDNNKSFKLSDSASGYFDVLSLFTEISNKKDSIIILDEPLTRLHHSKQRLVGNILFKNLNQNQIIMVTHSPSFINYEVIKNNNLIYVRHNVDNSRVYRRDVQNEIPKSHLLNPDIFFSNYVLAVEGATDEAVFKAISDSLDDLFWKYDILILNMQNKEIAKKFGKFLVKYDINFIILVDSDYAKKSNDHEYIEKNQIEMGKFHYYPFGDNKSDETKSIYIMSKKDGNMDNFLEGLGYGGRKKDTGDYYDFIYDIMKKTPQKIEHTLLFEIINKIKKDLNIQ